MTLQKKEDILNIIDSVFGVDPSYYVFGKHDDFELNVAYALLLIKEIILNEKTTD